MPPRDEPAPVTKTIQCWRGGTAQHQEVIDLALTRSEVAEAIETGDELTPTMANELTDWALLLLDRHAEDR